MKVTGWLELIQILDRAQTPGPEGDRSIEHATFTAVDAVSFTVRQGSVTGFLGPNGADKPNLGQ